jgi:hypothetical protein
VLERLQAAGPAPGAPDVSALVQKATTSFQQATEAEAKARAVQERETERRALLQQAFEEPVELLRALVDAYNATSAIAPLTLKILSPMSVEVRAGSERRSLRLTGHIVEDIDMRPDGIVRILALAEISPQPKAARREDFYDQSSFGGFNLIYRLRSAHERYGDWLQLRFEINPLMPQSSYPHWFGIDFADLPRQIQLLRAMGQYQHQQRALDDEWFKALLVQML